MKNYGKDDGVRKQGAGVKLSHNTGTFLNTASAKQ
jgi:hypothetical protein